MNFLPFKSIMFQLSSKFKYHQSFNTLAVDNKGKTGMAGQVLRVYKLVEEFTDTPVSCGLLAKHRLFFSVFQYVERVVS